MAAFERPLPRELDRLLHDLRGPLNAAFMHVEVLKHAAPDDPVARRSLETIERELGRLGRMLPAAFDVLALEPGERARVCLRQVVQDALHAHALAGVTLAEGPWPDVVADAALLGLAVAHLVRNALTATAAAGAGRRPPHVSASAANGHAELTVRDWGVGLRSTNPRAAIRLSPSGKPGQTTVGLLTVERIARLHGGTLAFDTPPDGGSAVTLTLPAA